MTDVKPALLSALDAEYDKNPYDVQNKGQKMTISLDLFESLLLVLIMLIDRVLLQLLRKQ